MFERFMGRAEELGKHFFFMSLPLFLVIRTVQDRKVAAPNPAFPTPQNWEACKTPPPGSNPGGASNLS
jgi:hypothetical protein